MTDIPRQFKGVWIPAEVWLDRDLSITEKVMMVEISSLQDPDRGCYASNSHFGKFFNLSNSRISEIISSLAAKGLVTIELVRDGRQVVERRVRLTDLFGKANTYSEKASTPFGKGVDPYSGKAKGSNTKIINTSKGEKGERAEAQSPPNVRFDGTDFFVAENLLTKWATAFPGVNIDLEIERASVWAASNPPKKDWQRFLSNWLSKKSGTVVDETNVPVDQIIGLYGQVCPNLPAVTVASDKVLRSMIVERWNESPTHQSGKDFWLPFFQKANNRNQVFFRGANVTPRLEALVSRSVFREISEAAQ